jgi:hypothetical protein
VNEGALKPNFKNIDRSHFECGECGIDVLLRSELAEKANEVKKEQVER